MLKRKKLLYRLSALALILSIYPAFVLGYTWCHVFLSELKGGRHGPLDAYRHTLASAVVSYTLHERVVEIVNRLFESKDKDSNKMDRHINLLGARIGAAASSFRDLEPTVRMSVSRSVVNSTDTNQITWLPEDKWRNVKLW